MINFSQVQKIFESTYVPSKAACPTHVGLPLILRCSLCFGFSMIQVETSGRFTAEATQGGSVVCTHFQPLWPGISRVLQVTQDWGNRSRRSSASVRRFRPIRQRKVRSSTPWVVLRSSSAKLQKPPLTIK